MMIDQKLYIQPKKIIELTGNLLIIYDDYVIKFYLNSNKDISKTNHIYLKKKRNENEVFFLQNFQHPFIIKYLYLSSAYIILERATCNLITAIMWNYITYQQILNFFIKLERSFKKYDIIHRDLSLGNLVYFKQSNSIKVIDFEIASCKNTNIKNIQPKHRKTKDNFKDLKEQAFSYCQFGTTLKYLAQILK